MYRTPIATGVAIRDDCNTGWTVRITDAALRRGYTVEQIEHAVVHHIDEFPSEGMLNLSMLIGPTPTGELLGMGVELAADGITIERVAHVMRARKKHLRKKQR